MKKIFALSFMLVVGLSVFLMAHSGGTDSFGCHVDHSTGIRHCH